MKKTRLIIAVIFSLGIAILLGRVFLSMISSNSRAYLAGAVYHAGVVNRAQQAYYLDHKRFAVNIEDLAIGTATTIEYENPEFIDASSKDQDLTVVYYKNTSSDERSYPDVIGCVRAIQQNPEMIESVITAAPSPGIRLTPADCKFEDRDVLAMSYVGAINYSQRQFYLKYKHFARNRKDLGLESDETYRILEYEKPQFIDASSKNQDLTIVYYKALDQATYPDVIGCVKAEPQNPQTIQLNVIKAPRPGLALTPADCKFAK